MKGHVLGLSTCLAFWALCALCLSLSQHAELASRVFALILLPMVLVAVVASRKPSDR